MGAGFFLVSIISITALLLFEKEYTVLLLYERYIQYYVLLILLFIIVGMPLRHFHFDFMCLYCGNSKYTIYISKCRETCA